MARRKKKEVHGLRIIDIGHKGNSIAKDEEGKVYLLRGGVPGDVVTAEIRRKKKGMPFGDVTNIIESSPDRVQPFCEHFEECGGCKWQDLSVDRQAHHKEKQVHDALRRIAGESDYIQRDIVKAERTRHFRNKLEFSYSAKRWLTREEIESEEVMTDRRALGFHPPKAWHRVVHISQCHLMDDSHNAIRNAAYETAKKQNIAFYDAELDFGVLRSLMIRQTKAGETMVVLVVREYIAEMIDRYLKTLQSKFQEVSSWYYIVNEKPNDSLQGLEATHYSGETHIQETLGSKKYLISPLSFFQTNSYQAEALYDIVLRYCQLSGEETVYDLYCGTGSIGIYVADLAKKVIGIELSQDAITDAEKNQDINALENTTFLCGDVLEVMDDDFVSRHGRPDVVICDPPRAGMHKDFVQKVRELNADKIVYVSCNPATLARDISLLSDAYKLVECTPVEMFPHTSHVESIALLEKKKT